MKQSPSHAKTRIKNITIAALIMLFTLIWLTACTSSKVETETEAVNSETTIESQASESAEDIPIENGGRITPDLAKERLDSDEAIILVDVRTEQEFGEGHIPDALLLPLATLENDAATIIPDLDATYFVYCRSGSRSAQAVKELLDLGYTSVYDLGGIINWPYEVEMP